MLQNHALFGIFLICERFPAKLGGFIVTRSRKISALNQQNLMHVLRTMDHCSLKLLATAPYSQVSTLEDLEIDDESCIDPDLCEG